jgi:polysaccharide export outer membrane protein
MRFELKSLLQQSGVPVDGFAGDIVTTAYQFDMSKADRMFLADDFNNRNRDVIIVAESPSTEIIKFMAALNSVTVNSSNIATTASGVSHALRRTAVAALKLGCHLGAMRGR